MKVLNLDAGLGGNRKLWENVDVTAVEINPEIARFYRDCFPQDNLIVGDARKYLLKHYKEFDFIWSSPECQKNSRARYWGHSKTNPKYPNLEIYERYIFLLHHFEGRFVVENVEPYYKPLIEPSKRLGRHLFWSNFRISGFDSIDADINQGSVQEYQKLHGFDITGYKFERKDRVLRNCVHPETGLHILNCARGVINQENVKQTNLFESESA